METSTGDEDSRLEPFRTELTLKLPLFDAAFGVPGLRGDLSREAEEASYAHI